MTEPRRERKVVTVLFADLVGFTARSESLDPEDVEAILRPYHARLREELEQRGGTVEKFVGDAVMAVFGAPTAHEDDPERAVRAALAIRDSIVEDGTLEVRIGVNTGEALVNIDARPDHGEGMVAGDVVNTAARLQSAAPTNGILVGESTHRATAHMIDYREHAAIDAKGKAEPVPVWEVDQARARAGVELRAPTTPLVGRERERELLLGAFDRARGERATQLVTIVGVPGIGKSRLVAELYAEIEREPDITYWRSGRSLPYGEGVAFWAFAEMVKAQAGILETDHAGDAERKLREAVVLIVPEADAPWVESRLRPLVGLESAAGARDESFAAWRRFVESLAEHRPTVVVFEDLHWADDDLLDFVDGLVDWLTDVPLLVIATARPELLDRRPGLGWGEVERRQRVALAARGRRHGAPVRDAPRSQRAPGRDAAGAARARRRQPSLRRAVRAHAARSAASRVSYPRRCRASSRRASTRCPRRKSSCCSTQPCSARRSGSVRSAVASKPKRGCTRCSGRSSCDASGAAPSRERRSSRSRTCSSGTSRTDRFPAPSVP